MLPFEIEIVRRVFPGVNVEVEGDAITIDGFLRIQPKQVQVKTMLKKKMVDGYELTLDNGEDAEELGESRRLSEVIIAAAKVHGGWKAKQALEAIDCEQFAKEFRNN